ncbi:hypothetical protein [Lentibacillus sp. Marseille-P4043]|uniref:hypothetical protein n=1 Tax=Lentibacillus sp. Marseille-P4043 TaxID=2040293 RepID=UPI00131A5109|nr:hypothetical protein [Lentibacillus sp. Marseille-P4043]
MLKHQPERGNINPNAETSARMREHQPERGNIDRKRENINLNTETSTGSERTSARMGKHQPEC